MGRGRLAMSHGMQQAISTPAPPKPAPQPVAPPPPPPQQPAAPTFHAVNWQTHLAIMHEMGQTGREGQGYVNTSQAFIVNRFLRNGGDMADAHKATPNWDWITRSDVQRTIRRMDSEMRPLSRNIQGVRFVGLDFLASLGVSPAGDRRTVTQLNAKIKAGTATFADKAFTSFSTDARANVFTAKGVKINYHLTKGTQAIMTTNRTESEGVLARGVKQRITGARLSRGKLEIDVTV